MAERAFHDLAATPVPAALEGRTIELALFPEGDDAGVVVDGWMTRRFRGGAQLFTWDPRFAHLSDGRTMATCVTHLAHGWRDRAGREAPHG